MGGARNAAGGGAVRLRGAGGRRRGHGRERDPLRLARATSPADCRPANGELRFKTSIVFWGLADSPGSLVGVLQEFAGREVNLSKIESRPRKQGLGRYVFFADLEGAQTEPAIADALAAVRRSVETLRVLGCYPAASQPAASAGAHPAPVTLSASAVEAATARAVAPAAPAGSRGAESGESAGPPPSRGRGEPTRGTCTPSAGGRPAPG